jgi:DNA helicase-2/ATP-dependent DNA helicase PcrA
VEHHDPERLLADLDPAQREAVQTAAAPLCILAGAGSGKTRVLTRRIARRVLDGSADPGHVLAVTFTRKAAGELRSRIGALGIRDQVAAGTFHALAYAQLRRRWADRGERAPALVTSKVKLLVPLLPRRGETPAIDVASEIEWAKARMVVPSHYEQEVAAARRTPPLPASVIAGIYAQYEEVKRRKGLVDFDDLLSACAFALETEPEFAAAQRWRFRHLFVDEYQDLNPVQHRLLMGWLGDRHDLCVVGDPNQAIYSWNGADPTFLTEFGRRFPGAEVVRLDRNYRSTPQVLATAAAVLPAARMQAARSDGDVPVVRSYDADVAEARAVAAAIRRKGGPGRWSRFAVLVRTNAQGVLFEEAFRRIALPYRVRGGAFLQLPHVREAIAVLRRAPAAVPFRSALADVESMAAEAPPERRLDLDELVRLGLEYEALDGNPTREGFDAWLATTVKSGDAGADADAIEIVTFHRAKGLEWPVVFVAGLERGLVPIGHATSPAAEAEERRLLYVALTRAQDELHCSWAERRTFGTKSVHRSPSPWLDLIDDACAALDGRTATPDVWKQRIAGERQRLRPRRLGAGADPDLLAALKEWRSNAARAAKIPAYVIFHDTTLAAIAEAKPSTAEELLAVPGLGPVKTGRYGEALLRVVASGRAASA